MIFLGKKAADAFHRLDANLGAARIDVYPRTNGDTYVTPDARLLLDRLMAEQMCAATFGALPPLRDGQSGRALIPAPAGQVRRA